MRDFPVKQQQDENFSETAKGREKYKDTEAAAEAAFQFASQAAAAARAAVKLSKTQDGNSDESQNSSNHERYPFHFDESLLISELRVDAEAVEKNQKKEVELERGVVRNDDEAKKKHINETVTLKSFSGEKSILRTKPDIDGDLSNENKDELTCKPPNDNLLIQADSTKGKSELEGAQQKDSVEEMSTRASKAGRRPFSMRTRRVNRN